MTIPYGNILVIKGRVGTGKSTLLRSIAGVVELSSGDIINSINSHINSQSSDAVDVLNGVHSQSSDAVDVLSDVHSQSSDAVDVLCGVHSQSSDAVDVLSGVHSQSSDAVDSSNCTHLSSHANCVAKDSSDTVSNTKYDHQVNDIKILDSIYLHSSAEFNFVTGYLKDELILSSVLTDANSDISRFSEFIDRSIYDLSGGELKRLSIMIALEMGRDKVILLDEPLDMLDDEYASMISREIIEMSKTTPFIIATHDTHFDDYADTIIEIII